MAKRVYAISFAQPENWTRGHVIQVGVAEEKVDELREYAKSLGYEENVRGPLVFDVTEAQYEQKLKEDYKAFFKEK